MLISISNPIGQTYIFSIIFLAVIFLSIKKIREQSLLSKSLTDQLKGVAILMIIFSHIGYFLSSDHSFLFPLSILSGVGVNLFLFLSGLGLSSSHLINKHGMFKFYKKRLSKLYIALWVVLSLFLLMDLILLGKHYSLSEIIYSYLGFFPNANLYSNLDSPLWYFSLILFYYLVFPIFFRKKLYVFSPLLIYILSFILTERFLIPVSPGVMGLYKVHLLAFPLGMAAALINHRFIKDKYSQIFNFKNHFLKFGLKYLSVNLLLFVVGYTAINSGVGGDLKIEHAISILTTLCVILIFDLIDFDFKLFNFFGRYSYEIYLFHWPLMYRYDLLYQHLPAYLATLIYLAVFIGLGFTLQKTINYLTSWRTFLKSSG